jgi:D-galacturonate reductase
LNFRGFPETNIRDAEACELLISPPSDNCCRIVLTFPDKSALKALPKGSAVIIFTPDSTHFPIASEALNLGHHVLVTKPATQKVEDHQTLIELAKEKGLICFVEQ